MTKLKGTQKIILEAIRRAAADEPKRDFIKKDKKGKSLFAMVPYAMILNKRVTTMDVGVYAIILGHCIRSGVTSIRISQKEIAHVLETSSRMVSFSITNLESLDWLKIERHFKATSNYSPKSTETLKAKKIRLSYSKPTRRKKWRGFQKLFLEQIAEAEEAKKNFLSWFKSLPIKEAEEFYQENSDFMDYINEEDSE